MGKRRYVVARANGDGGHGAVRAFATYDHQFGFAGFGVRGLVAALTALASITVGTDIGGVTPIDT